MVPAMAQADPTIKFAAVELSDWVQDAEDLPAHLRFECDRSRGRARHALLFHLQPANTDDNNLSDGAQLCKRGQLHLLAACHSAGLAGVPVWVTENNVNADYALDNGLSNCNGTPFVLDPRGTSPFFAAWRSLVFELLGQAGAQALYHWDFSSNAHLARPIPRAIPTLSYWVDYYLSHWLPSPPGQDILQTTSSGCCLWIDHSGNGLMLRTRYAHHGASQSGRIGSDPDVQSRGQKFTTTTAREHLAPSRSIYRPLGPFTSATLVTLDAATPPSGPVLQSLIPRRRCR
jgi:hypothetical protein